MEQALRVLWIDDDAETTKRWSTVFEEFGFQITPAGTASEAFELLKSSPYDLILVDLLLSEDGDVSGIDVIEKIRNQDELAPIFVLSGYLDQREYRAQLDRLVLSGLIPKPLPLARIELERILLQMELACKDADIARLQRKYGHVGVEDFMRQLTKGKQCFVLMPFRPEFDAIYEDIIRPIMRNKGINCARADEVYSVNPIIDDIAAGITRADFLVAELTTRNPNVMYELGLAHAQEKPVIMLAQDVEDIPFDLRHRRCILYTDTHRGIGNLKTILERTIDEIVVAISDSVFRSR